MDENTTCKSSLSGKASCKADLNNFKGKLFRGRVSIPGPLVERTSALPTELPGNSTRHRKASCKADWNNFKGKIVPSCVDIKGRVETVSGGVLGWLFNDTVSTTRLFSVDEIGDSEMIFGEMRPRIRQRLPCIHITVGENLGKNPTRWGRHVARKGESRNAYRVLVGRPEGKRPLGRPRRRGEDNIKIDLREVGYDDRDWINLAQDRDQWRAYVRAAMNLRGIAPIEIDRQLCQVYGQADGALLHKVVCDAGWPPTALLVMHILASC
ncbi:hypothetical protein ANN_09197 [Periplaneta americana]|uniref:Uncharacterized protein n=1 Tax=Periplaneta americana TaxID=6978 RepID=A0ABQ8TP83_PERAM|nr:hypothetical protein ANN_09197 [Periplaneta americana]